MNQIRYLSLAVLVGILAIHTYVDPPVWWWLVKPVVMMPVWALMAMPLATKLSLVAVVALFIWVWKFLRKWALHALVLLPLLTGFIGFMMAVSIMLYVLVALLLWEFYASTRRWWARRKFYMRGRPVE
ncbi:MAG: hypothetical protein V4474_04335 [Patescibacteria group bacterium]